MANCTILLIDYEPRSIERFRDPLTAAGYSVEIATDGVSGIEAFHRLNPDMVLVEAMIPKKHGFEVCQELKRTPHGRRTPVIITTGVYKGRKYRTQALHIYGCDEYIEKPIAAEQLLGIVGKFFEPGPTGPSSRNVEPERDRSGGGDVPSARTDVDAIGKPAPTAVKSDTDDEITARLDALLSGGNTVPPTIAAPARSTVSPIADQDPFATMRAEINAEFGELPAPLPFEAEPKLEPMSEPIPSDQKAAPSLIDTLPITDVEISVESSKTSTPIVPTEGPSGQVVSFDSRRSRKGKKTDRLGAERPLQPAPPSSDPKTVPGAAQAIEPTAHPPTPAVDAAKSQRIDTPAPVSEMTLPRGTQVESELDVAEGRRRRPVWIWVAAVVIGIGAVVFFLGHGGSNPREMTATSAPPPQPAASRPTAESAAPAEESPIEAPAKPPEPVAGVAVDTNPVVDVVRTPTPKKPINRATSTPSRASASGSRTASSNAATSTVAPSVATPKNPEHATAAQSKGPENSTATPEPPPAPPDSGVSASGVESVPDPSIGAPSTVVKPGALIPIDVADTMPVAVSRKAPVLSAETKRLGLSGTIIMNVLVNDHGAVDQVVLVSGIPGGDLNETAMRAARSWTYRPATKNGLPVRVWKSEQLVIQP